MSAWDGITAEELRIAARVARASGGVVMSGAASAWDLRADIIDPPLIKAADVRR